MTNISPSSSEQSTKTVELFLSAVNKWTASGEKVFTTENLEKGTYYFASISLIRNQAEYSLIKDSTEIEIVFESSPAINTQHPESVGNSGRYPPRSVLLVLKLKDEQ